MRRTLLICMLLSAATMAVFWPVVHHDFVNYDDNCYVAHNPQIRAGLTWQGLTWAFGRLHGDHTYWHPLTWVSHMVDCQLFGTKPAGHHLMSLLFHTLNSLLVFLVFQRMTGAVWRSALLAALFALHPLQVDTVAWVAERKNLLSATFFLLTVWAYARYAEVSSLKSKAQSPKAGGSPKSEVRSPKSDQKQKTEDGGQRTEDGGRKTEGSSQRSESTDHAPRTTHHAPRITHHASRFTFHVSRLHPPSSIFYLLSLLCFALGLMCKPVLVTLPFVLLLLDYWPLRRLHLPWLKVPGPNLDVGCWMFDVRCSPPPPPPPAPTPLLRLIREKLPFFTLAAVSCYITSASNRALGKFLDPSAGFPLAIRLQNALLSYVKYLGKAFWPVNLSIFYPYPEEFPAERTVACGLLLLAISGLAIVTIRSRPYLLVGWCWFLGVLVPFIGLVQAGEQAMADRFAYVPLIGVFLMLVWGAVELARRWFRRRLIPAAIAVAVLVCCAGLSRRQTGFWQNSVTLFSHALDVTGDSARSHSNLGQALAEEGKLEEGIQHLLEATRLNPDHAIAYWAIGSGRAQQGRFDEAIECYETALRLKPDFPEALNNLAWVRATHSNPKYRDGTAAVELAERACRLTGQLEPMFIGTLAAAYAEAGRFGEAVKAGEKARALATGSGQKELAEKNLQLLDLYRAGKPYHETQQ